MQDQTELVFRVGPDGLLTFVNEAFRRFAADAGEQLIGRPWQHLAQVGDVALLESKLRTLSPDNPAVMAESGLRAKTGAVRWVQFVYRGIFDGDGRPSEVEAVGRDITDRKTAEERLRESEERFQQVAASAGVFVWEVDASGLYTYASSSVEHILGYTPAELVGKLHYYDLIPPSFREDLKAQVAEVFGRRAPLEAFASPIRTADDRWILVETTGAPFFDAAGNLAGYRGANRDITRLKRDEMALRESRATIQQQLDEIEAIYAAAPVGLCVVDAELRFRRINERLAEIHGLRADRHLGMKIAEVLPHLAPNIDRLYRRVLDTGEPLVDVELRCCTPPQPGIERVWLGSYYPLKAANGEVVGINVVVQEITERKRAEAALQESEERFRSMADSTPVIIWLTDAAGKVTFFNRQAVDVTGRSPQELSGRDWLELIHPEDVEGAKAAHRAALGARGSGKMELRLRCGDGQYRWMLATASVRFTGGRFAGFVGTLIDITEWKQHQEQALASQKLESLGVLAGGIAHDFNNLLGGILADAELVQSELEEGSPAREGVERIRRVGVRASGIVRELMAYSGHEIPEFSPVDLGALLADTAEFLTASIAKTATLKLDLPEDIPPVRANASQLRQLVLNLVTNASEALGEGAGVIQVSLSNANAASFPPAMSLPDGDYVRLDVSDTGCGMTEEVRSRIFDPFFTTKFPGRGLGLAAVHGIVRLHAGAIQVASAPGEGTRVCVLLPASSEPAAAETPTPGQPVREIATICSQRAILMVEDEESLRIAVCKMLRKKGLTVLEAADGIAAVDVFRAHQQEIGVVLLDLTLPGLSGQTVLTELRRLRPHIKVIVTTAYSKDTAATSLGGRDGWSFIRKPYRLADLMQALRESLA